MSWDLHIFSYDMENYFRRSRSDNPNDLQTRYVPIVKVELPSKETD